MNTVASIKSAKISNYFDSKIFAIFSWPFSCGIPLFLVMSTLSARLLEGGVVLNKIGMFGLASLPYSFKFIGGPLLERYSIPILTRYFGRACSWMIISMLGVAVALIWMGAISLSSPHGLTHLFIATMTVAFFSALNDTAEAEMRINLLNPNELSFGMASYAVGYRLGTIASGSGALIIASLYSWFLTYVFMAALMLIGVIAVMLQGRKKSNPHIEMLRNKLPAEKLSSRVIREVTAYFKIMTTAIKEFLKTPGWLLAILIIVFYYYSDAIIIAMANTFYLDIGLSKMEIGTWSVTIGTIMALTGGVLGGALGSRFGALPILFVSAIFHLFGMCGFAYLAHITIQTGHLIDLHATHHLLSPILLFKLIIVYQNFIFGLSSAGYITIMAVRCRPPYTATQNALMTSLMAGTKILFVASSGFLITLMNWQNFFIFLAISVIPSLLFIGLLIRVRKNEALSYD